MGRLEGKIAIVTGATSGMGEATVHRFVEEGAKVVFNGLGTDKGFDIEQQLKEKGGVAKYVDADLTDLSAIDDLVKVTLDTFGTIDVVYGNAGIARFFDFHEFDMAQDYDLSMDIMLRANFYLTRQVLPVCMEKRSGNFIYTCSVASEHGLPHNVTYSAAKGALKNMVKSLAMEYGKYNLRFNGILPGSTYSSMLKRGGKIEAQFIPTIPLGRCAEPWEIANAAVFFASDEVPFCTGAMLMVDGGQSCGIYSGDGNGD
ncbi:MAG: SDR family oxidoreductase [Clostridiales Family XIII bacterium]|jgi:NAD(P)-dependent dehydrogenase (short-subunit alcohol dehydrogenase family)|nr:SDR family oxidoreductase [Clostridiales Family XIII bacterium]